MGKMGQTEEEEPCECTDPEKKKKKGGKLPGVLGDIHHWIFGGKKDHDEVLEHLKKEQEAAERGNANVVVRKPYRRFIEKQKDLEKEILKTEEEYVKFKQKQDEYRQTYAELASAMRWHCRNIRSKYKGVRFDCERERVE